MRDGLRRLFEDQVDLELVGEAGGLSQGCAIAKASHPDLILLELNLDGELDLQAIPELLKAAPHARLLLVTGLKENQLFHQAVNLGVMGVVRKEESGRGFTQGNPKSKCRRSMAGPNHDCGCHQ